MNYDMDWDFEDDEYVLQPSKIESNAPIFCTRSLYEAVDMIYAFEYAKVSLPTGFYRSQL